jgi:hypothetical protein
LGGRKIKMQFKQKKDGSCTLNFNEEEIKIIQNKKSIYFTAEALRHFGNVLMLMVLDFNENFNEEIKNKASKNEEIKITEDNSNDNKS